MSVELLPLFVSIHNSVPVPTPTRNETKQKTTSRRKMSAATTKGASGAYLNNKHDTEPALFL